LFSIINDVPRVIDLIEAQLYHKGHEGCLRSCIIGNELKTIGKNLKTSKK
jgi:hypothetical protein